LFLQKFFNFIAEMAIDQACPDQWLILSSSPLVS
jgi:hypothetical protein